MSELKCCPFCGGEAKICNGSNDIVGSQFAIRCKGLNCTIRPNTQWHTELEEAIRHWNTRKPMSNIVEKLEEEKGKVVIVGKVMYQENYFIDIDKAIDIVKQEINNGLE